MTGELLFYSDFPFGYHNPEAEEKMARFAARGYGVIYVEQLGVRNPRPRHLLRLLRSRRRSRRPGTHRPFRVVSPKLIPPRGLPGVRQLNRSWLAAQLERQLADPARAILWVRYPTPELIGFLEASPAALRVYEVVDDHERSPGMTDRLRRVFRESELRILAVSDLVFAWSEPLRARLARLHPRVVLAPGAVDLSAFRPVASQDPGDPPAAVYTGAANFRFDAELIADVATRLPSWRIILAGTVSGDVASRLRGIENVAFTGQLARAGVIEVLRSANVCLMPYRVNRFSESLFPIKLIEYLAAGRSVVSTGAGSIATDLERFIERASGPGAFADAIERAAAADSPQARLLRTQAVQDYDWEHRIDQMDAALRVGLARARSGQAGEQTSG